MHCLCWLGAYISFLPNCSIIRSIICRSRIINKEIIMSKITEFYTGGREPHHQHTLAEMWEKDDDFWEYSHSHIQWAFPLNELSNFNPDAPLLTEEDIAVFKSDPKIQLNFLMSFCRFLNFLGLDYQEKKVVETEFFEPIVFKMANHNWPRITRVLKSLVLVGLEQEAVAFYNTLKGFHEQRGWVSDNAFSYWKGVIHGLVEMQ